jgi:hypothetical protein
MLILFVIVEIGLLAGGIGLKKLEKTLSKPARRRKKKRKKKPDHYL